MSKPTNPKQVSSRWRAAALAGLSLVDDVAVGVFVHARWGAGRALILGPKGILAGCALGLVAGAAWCLADSARPRRDLNRCMPQRDRR